MDRMEEAERLLLEAYDVLVAAEGIDAGRTRSARARLAELYDRVGAPDEAAKYRSVGGGRP
jgi:hypothetical protein